MENLDGMNDRIETSFSEIRDLLENCKNEMVCEVIKKRDQEISELKNELKAKNIQINELK
jgi:hypothetical protein